MHISQETQHKLMQFVHRTIKPGEAVILARLLADRIPVSGGDKTDNAWERTLQYRSYVDSVIFYLNDYIHIPSASRDNIYRMVDRIWMWRQSVACGESNLVFTGNTDSVVDDFTGVMRTVHLDDVCPIVDMLIDANYIYDLFKTVVRGIWNSEV